MQPSAKQLKDIIMVMMSAKFHYYQNVQSVAPSSAPAASLVAILRRLSYKIFRKRQFSWVETSNENENLLFKFLSIKERICRTKFIEIMGKCMDFGSGHIVQLQQQTKLFMWKVCLKNQYCYNCSTSTAFNPHQKIYN